MSVSARKWILRRLERQVSLILPVNQTDRDCDKRKINFGEKNVNMLIWATSNKRHLYFLGNLFFSNTFLHWVNGLNADFLLNCCNNSPFLQMTLPNYCNVQLQAEKQSTLRQATSCQNAERKNSANAFVVVRLLFFLIAKKPERQTTLVVH